MAVGLSKKNQGPQENN